MAHHFAGGVNFFCIEVWDERNIYRKFYACSREIREGTCVGSQTSIILCKFLNDEFVRNNNEHRKITITS